MPIGWTCLTSSKYDQTATLLRQGCSSTAPAVNTPENRDELSGSYVTKYHPVTGQPIRVWVEAEVPDDPETVIDERQVFTFKCQARSVITGGLNSQGTTERFTSKGSYENVDFAELHIPKNIIITKRDRVTNIKNSRGEVVWLEEEHGDFRPTVFDVRGVSPVLDPFGFQTEWFALLERASNQSTSGREGDNG